MINSEVYIFSHENGARLQRLDRYIDAMKEGYDAYVESGRARSPEIDEFLVEYLAMTTVERAMFFDVSTLIDV